MDNKFARKARKRPYAVRDKQPYNNIAMDNRVKILKTEISNVTLDSALEEVRKWLKDRGKKRYIVTPNPEILVMAKNDKNFQEILNNADLSLPDGIGLLWASKFLGRSLRERVAGADFMEKLCEMAEKNGLTVGLIGGKNQVAIKAAECLKKRLPKLKVILAQEEWGGDAEITLAGSAASIAQGPVELHPHPMSSVASLPAGTRWVSPAPATPRSTFVSTPPRAQRRNNLTIDFLFVAFGAPKQEIWISQNLKRLPVTVAMGVGGAFDYLAGTVVRAPKWMQNLGLEWLFRLIRQPWRIKRQLALLRFVSLVLREKFV